MITFKVLIFFYSNLKVVLFYLQVVPVVYNGTHDVISNENIPNDRDSNIFETNDGNISNELKNSHLPLEESRSAINNIDCLVDFNNDISSSDEQVVVYDTRQLNQDERVDDFFTDILISTNSFITENPSQLLLNVNNVIESEEKTTGTLIDIELTSEVNDKSKLEHYNTILDQDFNSEQNINVTCKEDGHHETNSESDNSTSLVMMSTLSCEKNIPEINKHLVDAKDLLGVDIGSTNDLKNNLDIENTGDQEISLDVTKNTCTDDILSVDKLSNISNSTTTEVQKSNQDLKEKIGNSIKLMFDNNEHLHLNLLEKQNIANIQSNTLKKVNNLFSSIKSYNFSNFRTNEEDLSKDKITSGAKKEEQNLSSVGCISNTSPENKDEYIMSFNSLSKKDNFNNKIDSQNSSSSHESIENTAKHELEGDTKSKDLVVQESTDYSKVNIEATDNPQLFKTNIIEDKDKSPISVVSDSYVLNSDLIHSVRNAAHEQHKSISLDSSPVKSNRHYDVQDELYLLKETNIRLLAEISK